MSIVEASDGFPKTFAHKYRRSLPDEDVDLPRSNFRNLGRGAFLTQEFKLSENLAVKISHKREKGAPIKAGVVSPIKSQKLVVKDGDVAFSDPTDISDKLSAASENDKMASELEDSILHPLKTSGNAPKSDTVRVAELNPVTVVEIDDKPTTIDTDTIDDDDGTNSDISSDANKLTDKQRKNNNCVPSSSGGNSPKGVCLSKGCVRSGRIHL